MWPENVGFGRRAPRASQGTCGEPVVGGFNGGGLKASLPQLGHDQPFSKPVSLGSANSLNSTGGPTAFSLN